MTNDELGEELLRVRQRLHEVGDALQTIALRLGPIESSLATIADREFITRTEFDPIKRLVYGTVSAVLLAVLGAALTFVLRHG